MNKILCVGAFAVLVVWPAFAGGGGEAPAAAAKPVVLDFPSWQAEEAGFKEFWAEAIPAFKAQNPNVDVKLTHIVYKDYIDTLTTRFAANNPPDILHLPARNAAQFNAQGWLAPLDGYLKDTDILANWTPLQSSVAFDGKNMGLLLMGYGYILYYNEKIFKDAGVALPKSPADMLAAAKALTNEKAGIFGFGLTTADHPNIYGDVSNLVYGLGLSFFKNGQYNFLDPQVVRAVDNFRELAKYSPKGTTTELKRQIFVDGKIAMIVDGPWVVAMFDKAAESIKPHLKIMIPPMPVITGNPSNSMHIPAGIAADRKDLVWKFIKTLATPELQARYTELTKSPAGRKNVVTPALLAKNPNLEVINRAAAAALNTWPESPNVNAKYAQYSKIVASYMMRLMVTGDPTQKVLEEMAAAVAKEIKP